MQKYHFTRKNIYLSFCIFPLQLLESLRVGMHPQGHQVQLVSGPKFSLQGNLWLKLHTSWN